MGIKVELLQWYTFFDKNFSGRTVKNKNIFNKKSAEELPKPIIRSFNKRKMHSPFIGNIWGAHLTDMQLISKFSKGFRFSLCVIDIYSKYAWVIPLKMELQLLILFKKS